MGVRHELSSYSFWLLFLQTLIIAAAGAYVYLFGIPASFKRYLQNEALENFGESQAKEYLKKGLDKIPDSDRPEVQNLRKQATDKIPSSVGDIGSKLGNLGGGK